MFKFIRPQILAAASIAAGLATLAHAGWPSAAQAQAGRCQQNCNSKCVSHIKAFSACLNQCMANCQAKKQGGGSKRKGPRG